MSSTSGIQDTHYAQAITSLEQTIDRLEKASHGERESLRTDLAELRQMGQKLVSGRVEIAVFGEISTGKSALINALAGDQVASVDVQGGWTKSINKSDWKTCDYHIPGLEKSQVVLVDTPGINEVGDKERGDMAVAAARQADLILFVADSDLHETEYAAALRLASAQKPMLFVLNKIDLYSPAQRDRLTTVLRDERLKGLIPETHFVTAAADPREVEYVIQSADGRTRSEWKKPLPEISELKGRIVEILDREGLGLVALNAALFASDKSDRLASLRVKLRDARAKQTIMGYAVLKSLAVALNPIPVADMVGAPAADVAMVVTLAGVYGMSVSWKSAMGLIGAITKATGWTLLAQGATIVAASFFKSLTFGMGTAITAIPQGAAAGYGSYIVGQAARYYFEHGASWGNESPKVVVQRILAETDKDSVLNHLKDEIRRRLGVNAHARTATPA